MGVTDMESQIYKNGVISVCVPSGWKLFGGIDSGGKETPAKVHIYKNIELKTDVFRKVGITICYYGEDVMYLPARDFYDNVKDIESFEMGRYVWYGYMKTFMQVSGTGIGIGDHVQDFQFLVLICSRHSLHNQSHMPYIMLRCVTRTDSLCIFSFKIIGIFSA